MKLKKNILVSGFFYLFLFVTNIGIAGSILGTYEQVTVSKPKAVKISANNVKIRHKRN